MSIGLSTLLNSLLFTFTQAEPEGWTVHEYGAVVGYGRECYERTRSHVLSWRVMEGVTFLNALLGVGWAERVGYGR